MLTSGSQAIANTHAIYVNTNASTLTGREGTYLSASKLLWGGGGLGTLLCSAISGGEIKSVNPLSVNVIQKSLYNA